ncbi:MAG: hypothetical protein DMD31_17875, partial [Gemmatimonadetes bacterium]
ASRLPLKKKVLFATLISLTFFVCLEAAVRVGAYFVYHRSPYFLFYGFKSAMADDDPEGHSAARMGYFKFPPSRVLHQYGMFSQPTPIGIDSLGFRGADFLPTKPPNVFRVICMGESSTFGFFDRDEFTYPATLERLFRERRGKGGSQVEVINTGIPHANSDNILAMFRTELLSYGPDVITVYAGYNDAAYMMDENTIQEALRWMHGHFATKHQIDLHVARYERNLRAIVALAKANGIRVVFIKQPMTIDYRREFVHNATPYHGQVADARNRLSQGSHLSGLQTTILVHSALMEVLTRLARDLDIPMVDNIAIVDEHPEYFASYVHLTEKGNETLAEALYKTIDGVSVRGAGALRAAAATHTPWPHR